jgi:hypothetical protein
MGGGGGDGGGQFYMQELMQESYASSFYLFTFLRRHWSSSTHLAVDFMTRLSVLDVKSNDAMKMEIPLQFYRDHEVESADEETEEAEAEEVGVTIRELICEHRQQLVDVLEWMCPEGGGDLVCRDVMGIVCDYVVGMKLHVFNRGYV